MAQQRNRLKSPPVVSGHLVSRKEQILDVATDLLLSRSFNSFSYKDLSERLGIQKASIHHHFPTKEALGVAVAQRLSSSCAGRLKEISRENPKPWNALEAYLSWTAATVRSGERICLAGCVQAEHNVVPEGMQKASSELCGFITEWLSGILRAGRDEGTMHFPGKPREQAALIHAALQGAMQNSRATGPREFTMVVKQIRGCLQGKTS